MKKIIMSVLLTAALCFPLSAEWSAAPQDAFMANCISGTTTYTQCKCSMDELQKKFPKDAMIRISMQDILNAVQVCTKGR